MQAATKKALSPETLRLNISGSAALPTPTKQAWASLSNGNILLERYGMTEVGMALSCGLAPEDRVDGSVGWPLPSVEARLFDTDTNTIIQPGQETDSTGKERSGEIQLRGPTIFKEYWRNPTATKKEFTSDGFFKTGDVAVRRTVPSAGKGASGDWAKGPMYFILGRASADILKVGGEKVSALEVEREMLSLPYITECAVVGLPSETWGQKVAAVVVLSEQGKTAGKGGKAFGIMDLRRALKDKLAAFKMPQDMKIVEGIPRNAMGKSEFFVQGSGSMGGFANVFLQSTRNNSSFKSLATRKKIEDRGLSRFADRRCLLPNLRLLLFLKNQTKGARPHGQFTATTEVASPNLSSRSSSPLSYTFAKRRSSFDSVLHVLYMFPHFLFRCCFASYSLCSLQLFTCHCPSIRAQIISSSSHEPQHSFHPPPPHPQSSRYQILHPSSTTPQRPQNSASTNSKAVNPSFSPSSTFMPSNSSSTTPLPTYSPPPNSLSTSSAPTPPASSLAAK